ncbi:MAG: hypothetical protein WKF96_04190 [Solirubrobacteraceae bacterium]
MRFVDFLRLTVLLSAAAASLLAVLCVAGASNRDETVLVLGIAGWWVVAAAIGLWLGRRAAPTPPHTPRQADAHAAPTLPQHRPGFTIVNRLWPLLLLTLVSGAIAFLAPQIPGIAAGFAIIWALAWRRQDAAVEAIEERDGVTFYVEKTAPHQPIRLVRTPGFRREVPTVSAPG